LIGVVVQLINEVDNRFSHYALLDAIGIVYPQYWLQLQCEENFAKHLEFLKAWYCEPTMLGFGESSYVVHPLLDHWQLHVKQGMFQLCMKNNSKVAMESSFDFNPLTCIWRTIHITNLLAFIGSYKNCTNFVLWLK